MPLKVPAAMTLAGVLKGVPLRGELAREWSDLKVAGLEYDSRRVVKDTLFFAFAGAKTDGAKFASAALGKGAFAVVSDRPRPGGFVGLWLQVTHGRQALATGMTNGVNSALVYALAVYNGELIASGVFDSAGGQSCANIARWNGTSWRPRKVITRHESKMTKTSANSWSRTVSKKRRTTKWLKRARRSSSRKVDSF